MTYPGSGGPWQPNDPQNYPSQQGYPGQQGGPQPGQPGWQQDPGQGSPQPTMAYGYDAQTQQNYGQPYGQQPGYGYPAGYAPAPPPKKRTGLIVGAVVAVVALAAGAVATVWAINSGSVNPGSASPAEAANKLVSAIGQSDVAGVLTSLPPAESSLMTDLNQDAAKELKRLEIYKLDANPDTLSGLQVKAENLTWDPNPEQVNDHVAIMKLTGGKVTLTADVKQLPLTDKFVDLLGGAPTRPETETIDIGKEVRQNGEPIRVATVKVDDEWYPSVAYTIADYALLEAKQKWPSQSIPANGGNSPEEAVRSLAQAALDADFRRVIELLPPDEMGALHDAGPVLLQEIADETESAEIEITKFETDTQDVSGGTKVLLTALEMRHKNETVSIRKDGDCYQAVAPDGETERLCAADLAAEFGDEEDMPPAVGKAMTNLASTLFRDGLGVVTVEVDGKHYLSPIRTFSELGLTAMRGLQPEDIEAMVKGGF